MSCVHKFGPSPHAQYEVCAHCGTHHSTAGVAPESVYGADYWSEKFGHSTIDEQVYNCDTHLENGISKSGFVLSLIEDGWRDSALEIGCAPGIMLKRLREDAGFELVTGIDVDRAYEADIRRIGGHEGKLLFGYFPQTNMLDNDEWFDLVVGMDVFEHSPYPEAFMHECVSVLNPGGQLILMLPLLCADTTMPERFFHPAEHLWMHTDNHMRMLAEHAGLTKVKFNRWTVGHETISAIKL